MDFIIQIGRVICLLVIVGLASCSEQTSDVDTDQRLAHIDNPAVKSVLTRALDAAGGIDTYDKIRSLSYSKRSILYHEDGTTESDALQRHEYSLQPELKGTISWTDSTGAHTVVYGSEGTYRELDGERKPESELSASRTFLSAYYVLFMPFKLVDPGVKLTHEGQITLDNGVIADVIKADYNPDENDNHSTADVWWYYFDKSDGRYLAGMVYHAPTYAFIENNETTAEHQIVFNTYRKSFRTDSVRNKQFLRGEFYYSEFEVK